jgi:hypothetical protein
MRCLARLGQSRQRSRSIGKGPPRSPGTEPVQLLDDRYSVGRSELKADERSRDTPRHSFPPWAARHRSTRTRARGEARLARLASEPPTTRDCCALLVPPTSVRAAMSPLEKSSVQPTCSSRFAVCASQEERRDRSPLTLATSDSPRNHAA